VPPTESRRPHHLRAAGQGARGVWWFSRRVSSARMKALPRAVSGGATDIHFHQRWETS
jgi:hypothetical protein